MRRILISLVVVVSACASLTPKEKVFQGHQTLRSTLVILDDTERQLCSPDLTQATKPCTNPLAATIGLTNEKHQAITKALVNAFEVDAKVANAILTWKATDPVPSDLTTLLADAQQTVSVIQTLSSSDLLTKAQKFLSQVSQLNDLLRGAK